MITDYQKFQLPDQNTTNNLVAEVNWNEDVKSNECKIIKFTCPNGDKLYVKREDLNNILFAIGKPNDQRNLIPQTLQTVHWRKTVLGIKATKDIHKGEMINFPIEISFPCTNIKTIIGANKFEQEVKQEQKKDKWATK